MNNQWKKILIKIIFALLAETMLTLLGIDDLANYNEFITEQKSTLIRRRFEQAIATQSSNWLTCDLPWVMANYS
jgi:hypothetical protein